MIPFKQMKEKLLGNPEVKKEYEKSKEENQNEFLMPKINIKEMEEKGLILGRTGPSKKIRKIPGNVFNMDFVPFYIQDVLLTTYKETGDQMYCWIDDYGWNKVGSFKDKGLEKDDEEIKVEVVENPNYKKVCEFLFDKKVVEDYWEIEN